MTAIYDLERKVRAFDWLEKKRLTHHISVYLTHVDTDDTSVDLVMRPHGQPGEWRTTAAPTLLDAIEQAMGEQ